jgi:hypothetical protein
MAAIGSNDPFSYDAVFGEGGTPPGNDPFSYDSVFGASGSPAGNQNTGALQDLGTDLKVGLAKVPGAITGMLDIPVGAITGRRMVSEGWDEIGKLTGFQPSQWAEQYRNEYSPGRQAANAEIDQVWNDPNASGWDVAGAYLTNPSKVAGMAVESLPLMLGGGAIARGAINAASRTGYALNPVSAAALGEGAVTGGATMDNISPDVDARTAALASLGAGTLTGGLGYWGGKLAERLGLADIDTLVAGGKIAPQEGAAAKLTLANRATRMGKGAVQEGVFEELPQSMQEQLWQNWAEGKPLGENVLRSGVEGALAGSAFGAIGNITAPPSAQTKDLLGRSQEEISGTLGEFRRQYGDRNPTYDPLMNRLDPQRGIDLPEGAIRVTPRGEALTTPEQVQAFETFGNVRPMDLIQGKQTATQSATSVNEQAAPAGAAPEIPFENITKKADLKRWADRRLADNTITEDQHVDIHNLVDQSGKKSVAKIRDRITSALAPAEAPAVETTPVVPATQAGSLASVIESAITPAQIQWWQARQNPDNENKSDAEIAKELGFTRQNANKLAKASRKGIAAKLAKQLGMTPADADTMIVNYLRESAPVAAATENPQGLSPDLQASELETGELFGNTETGVAPGMGVIDSIGGSQSDIGGTPVAPPNYDPNDVTPSDNTVVHAAQEREAALAPLEGETIWNFIPASLNVQAVDIDDAAAEYEQDLIDGDIPWGSLPLELQASWVKAYINYADGKITAQQYSRRFGEIADEAKQLVTVPADVPAPQQARIAADTGANRSDEPSRSELEVRSEEPEVAVQDSGDDAPAANPLESRVNALRPQLGEKQTARLEKLIDRYATRDIELDRFVEELDALEQQAFDTDKGGQGVRYSQGDTQTGSDAAQIGNALRKLFLSPAKFNSLVSVVQSVEQIPEDVRRSAQLSTADRGTQGFSLGNKVWLIADNIPQGNELAVFLHEMGVHIGMERLVGKENFNRLGLQIKRWAALNNDSIESTIAKAALARVKSAERSGGLDKTNTTDIVHERVAYFVEEAVKAGINPLAVEQIESAGLRTWFRQFIAAMKSALRKIGLMRFDSLTAQNVVDLAYGAADLELNGTYHGTAADFRQFDHNYMGTGEGAQAFGWGTYLAQKYGIAKDYWKRDTRRKGHRALDIQFLYDGEVQPAVTPDSRDASHIAKVVTAVYGAGMIGNRSASTIENIYGVDQDVAEAAAEIAKTLDVNKGSFRQGRSKSPEGSLMAVRPTFSEDEMLDWDKPLSDQSEVVKEALGGNDLGADTFARGQRGEQLYSYLVRKLGSDKAASEYLDSIGIKGIKFLDATSRSKTKDVDHFKAELARIQERFDRGETSRIVLDVAKKTLAEAERSAAAQTRNIVVFNDDNLVRINSQVGADPDRIRFSKVEVPEQVKAAATDIGAKLKEVSPKLLSNFQLRDVYGAALETLGAHTDIIDAMTRTQQELVRRAQALQEKWGGLAFRNKAVSNQLSKAMYDATLNGMHPDLAFDDPLNKHLTAKDRAKFESLKSAYRALPQEARDIYQEAKSLLAANWEERKNIYAGVVRSAYANQMAEAVEKQDDKRIKELNRKIEDAIQDHAGKVNDVKGPYFPLLRFGDYLVIAESKDLRAARDELSVVTGDGYKDKSAAIDRMEKDPKHYQVHAFEKQSERDAKATELEKAGLVTRATKGERFQAQLRPTTFGMVNELSEKLGEGFDRGAAAKVKDAMTELILAASPENAALTRQLKRQGVEGATMDMLRAFAEVVERDSFYLARMKHMDGLMNNMHAMYKESGRAKDGFSSDELRNVYNNVRDRMALDFQYNRAPVASFLTRMSSIWHLGVAPSYILTNMTQPFMISVPQLAGRYGMRRTFGEMRRAWVDSIAMIRGARGGTFGSLKDVQFDSKSIRNPGELDMINSLLDMGKLDIAQNIDTELVASGTNPTILRGIKVFNWASHNVELVNRMTTALAAYRLARGRGMEQDRAIQEARNAIELTQLDYSDTNAAYFMKQGHFGGWNRIPMQFRKYQQGMIYMLWRNGREAFKGDKEAQQALAYTMGMQMLIAGASGLPLYALIGLGGGGDDEKGDLETQMRNWLADAFGPDAARVIWKGLPSILGMDATTMGMGNLLKPLPMLRMQDVTEARTGQDAMSTLLMNAAGAPMDLPVRFYDAYQYWEQGDVAKGFEKALPKFPGSLVKAARVGAEGISTRSDNVVVEPDQINAWDMAIKAAGFSPMVESEHYTAQNAKEGTARAIKAQRDRAVKEYAQAVISGTTADDARAMIDEFNAEHPGYRINGSTLRRAVAQRRNNQSQLDEAGVRYSKQDAPLEGISRFAY